MTLTTHIRYSASFISLLAALVFARPVWAALAYNITDLGTLGGTFSTALGVNSNGQVVGYSYMPGDVNQHAFLYSNGTMTDLGTLGGANSTAYGINDNGQVVGDSYLGGPQNFDHAFVYSNGSMTDIGTLGGANSTAYGINYNGQVVGNSDTANSGQHAFLYGNGSMTDLGCGSASAINNNGQAAGIDCQTIGTHAVIYNSDGSVTDLGTLSTGTSSVATDLNNNGQVVGYAGAGGIINPMHAFLYSNGTMTDLGTLGGGPSEAFGINSSGQVVGYAFTAGNASQDAFLYSNGSMQDLNDLIDPNSGWTLSYANAINDNGQIVGEGTINGQAHAYLMTPVSSVPIPASGWLFGSGFLAILGFARKKRAQKIIGDRPRFSKITR